MKVQLRDFNTKRWISRKSIHVIGSAFYKGDLLETEALHALFGSITEVDQLSSLLLELDGSFSVIIDQTHFKAFAVDRWASIPLLFQQRAESILVGNDLWADLVKNEEAIEHFIFLASTPENQTLFKNWSTLKAGELFYNELGSSWKSRQYFSHRSASMHAFLEDECLQCLEKATDQMIMYLDGRRAVIPLSDGLDSRLIVAELVKRKYPDILCFTYGQETNRDIDRAKAICNALHVDWEFVPYDEVVLKSILSDEWRQYDSNSHFGVSLPYDQDFFALAQLKANLRIDPNTDVILPGYLGDHLGGSFHVFNKDEVDRTVFLSALCDKFLISDLPNEVSSKLIGQLSLASKNELLSTYQAWLSIHRHSRFIFGGWRAMDHFGFDSYVFAGNKDWVNFWYQLKWEERLNQHRYSSFLHRYMEENLNLSFSDELEKTPSTLKSNIKKVLPKSIVTTLKKHSRNQSNYERILLNILRQEGKLSAIDRKDNFNVVHSQLLLNHLFK